MIIDARWDALRCKNCDMYADEHAPRKTCLYAPGLKYEPRFPEAKKVVIAQRLQKADNRNAFNRFIDDLSEDYRRRQYHPRTRLRK